MPLPVIAIAKLKLLIDPAAWRPVDGQDLLEYAMLVALIAIIALGAVATVGNTINTVFWTAIAASNV
jgi:Flp pilus assembly pilin Flp